MLGIEWLAARFSHLELYQSAEDRRGLGGSGRSEVAERPAGNGTDLSSFDPAAVPAARVAALRAELNIPPDALVVGAVGRLVREKGYEELARAARRSAR